MYSYFLLSWKLPSNLWPVRRHSIGLCCIGSPVYVAPEVLQKKYGQKADVWSAGMVAYLLLCARLPWKGDQSITTSDLYVSMGDGKSFNRKVQLTMTPNSTTACASVPMVQHMVHPTTSSISYS